MHIPTDWTDRIVAEDGQIYRILTAIYSRRNEYSEIDVYKENDAGESWDQNLYQSCYGSCAVAFPGLPRNPRRNSWYYDESIAQEEGWSARSRLSTVGYSDDISDRDIELITSFYPDFIYVFKKYQIVSKAHALEILRKWIPHHDLELVLAAGFVKIGLNGNFWRLSEKNRKAICLFMRRNPQFKDFSLAEIRKAMKAGDPVDYANYLAIVPSYHRWDNSRAYYPCISYEDYKYLKRIKNKVENPFASDTEEPEITEKRHWNHVEYLYSDYKTMLYRSDHNCHDEYWMHPSDLEAFHDRLVEEERIKREQRELAERAARAEAAKQKALKEKSRIKVIKAIEKKFAAYAKEIDGYSFFVTADYSEWERQAKALSQCICACGYYGKMGDGNEILVFIQKDGEPVATAEVFQGKKLGQFYGNEIDRANCKPSKEVEQAFQKWLDNVPASKFNKPRQRKSEKKEVAA